MNKKAGAIKVRQDDGGFVVPPDLVPALREFLESGQLRSILIPGWICSCCGKLNAPDVEQCDASCHGEKIND